MPHFIVLAGEEKKFSSFLNAFENYNTIRANAANSAISAREIKFVVDNDEDNFTSSASITVKLASQKTLDFANILLPRIKILTIMSHDDGDKNKIQFIWKPVMNENLFEQLLAEKSDDSDAFAKIVESTLNEIQKRIAESVIESSSSTDQKTRIPILVSLHNSSKGWIVLQSRSQTDLFLRQIGTNTSSSNTKTRTFLIKSDASCVVKGSHSMLHLELNDSEEEARDLVRRKLVTFLSNRKVPSAIAVAPQPWIFQPTKFYSNKQFMIKTFFAASQGGSNEGVVFLSVYHNNLPEPQKMIDLNNNHDGDDELNWKHSKSFFSKCPQFVASEHESQYPFLAISLANAEKEDAEKIMPKSLLCQECFHLLVENRNVRKDIVEIARKIRDSLELRLFGIDVVITVATANNSSLEYLVDVVDVNAFPDYSGIHPIEKVFECIL